MSYNWSGSVLSRLLICNLYRDRSPFIKNAIAKLQIHAIYICLKFCKKRSRSLSSSRYLCSYIQSLLRSLPTFILHIQSVRSLLACNHIHNSS
ncbi:hypothetical protein H6F50_09795 [Coleofasciculus sp. FACHB-712]|nr:hypothetical protein [Coleofasciculus sp. FACHB-712]